MKALASNRPTCIRFAMPYVIAFSRHPDARSEVRRTAPAAMSVADQFFGEGADAMVITTPKGRKITFLQLAALVQDGLLA